MHVHLLVLPGIQPIQWVGIVLIGIALIGIAWSVIKSWWDQTR